MAIQSHLPIILLLRQSARFAMNKLSWLIAAWALVLGFCAGCFISALDIHGPIPSSAAATNVDSFGAIGDGKTDDAASILRAMKSVTSTGGVVQLSCSKTYYIGESVTVPPGVTIEGCLEAPDNPGIDWRTARFSQLGKILRAPTATFFIGRYSGLKRLLIMQSGITFPAADAHEYAGTAISLLAAGSAQAATLRDVMVLGANLCFDGTPGGDRIRLQGFFCDGNSGIVVGPSYDTSIYHDIHLYPYGTVAYNGGATGATLNRSGIGFTILNGASDDTDIDVVLDFGHARGFSFASNGNLKIGRLWADNNAVSCFRFQATGAVIIDGLFAYSCGISLVVDKNAELQISKFYANTATADCIELDGTLSISSADISHCEKAALNITTSTSIFNSAFFRTRAIASSNLILLPAGFMSDNIFVNSYNDGTESQSLFGGSPLVLPTLQSGSSLVLNKSSDRFLVAGNASVGTIKGGWGGREVMLIFDSTAMMLSDQANGNIVLNHNLAFGGVPGNMIKLIFDNEAGGVWREEWRSSPK